MKITKTRGWLLDTHALLWMLYGDKRLSRNASQAIDGKLPVYHSLASFWEISIKLANKGFDFIVDDDWDQLFPAELNRIGVPLLVPTIDDCTRLQDLPKHHGDPFDRMFICQAGRLGLGIISADKIIDSYGVIPNPINKLTSRVDFVRSAHARTKTDPPLPRGCGHHRRLARPRA